MHIPKTESEIFEFVKNQHEEISDLFFRLNQDYGNHIEKNIFQRREFFKYIATIASAILAISPTIFDKVENINLFYFGVSLLILTVILITNTLLSVIDKEGNDLGKQLNEFNHVLYEQIDRSRDFFIKGIYTPDSFSKYLTSGMTLEEIREKLPQRKKLKENNKSIEKMDYSGEFFVTFFILGTVSLLVSMMNIPLSICYIVLFLVILIWLVFFYPTKIFTYLGYPFDLIKKYISY